MNGDLNKLFLMYAAASVDDRFRHANALMDGRFSKAPLTNSSCKLMYFDEADRL